MFNFGIAAVSVALACPGARRIVVLDMVDGSFALMYPGGKIEWVPAHGKGLFHDD
jgi:hypothetical protein